MYCIVYLLPVLSYNLYYISELPNQLAKERTLADFRGTFTWALDQDVSNAFRIWAVTQDQYNVSDAICLQNYSTVYVNCKMGLKGEHTLSDLRCTELKKKCLPFNRKEKEQDVKNPTEGHSREYQDYIG